MKVTNQGKASRSFTQIIPSHETHNARAGSLLPRRLLFEKGTGPRRAQGGLCSLWGVRGLGVGSPRPSGPWKCSGATRRGLPHGGGNAAHLGHRRHDRGVLDSHSGALTLEQCGRLHGRSHMVFNGPALWEPRC